MGNYRHNCPYRKNQKILDFKLPHYPSETRGQLTEVWNRIYLIRKESGYKTEEIAEEVLHEVEEWLEDLFEAGAIKKNPK
jgi:hypothetical protein